MSDNIRASVLHEHAPEPYFEVSRQGLALLQQSGTFLCFVERVHRVAFHWSLCSMQFDAVRDMGGKVKDCKGKFDKVTA